MAPDTYTAAAFDAKRQADGWTRIREFTSVEKAAEFLASDLVFLA